MKFGCKLLAPRLLAIGLDIPNQWELYNPKMCFHKSTPRQLRKKQQIVVFNTIQDLMYYIVLTVSFVVVPGDKNEETLPAKANLIFWSRAHFL